MMGVRMAESCWQVPFLLGDTPSWCLEGSDLEPGGGYQKS